MFFNSNSKALRHRAAIARAAKNKSKQQQPKGPKSNNSAAAAAAPPKAAAAAAAAATVVQQGKQGGQVSGKNNSPWFMLIEALMFPGYASSVAKQNIFSSEKRNNPNSCKSQTPQYSRRRCCFQFFSKVLSSIKKIFFPLQAETKLTTASVPLCNGGGGGQNGNPVPPALSNNPNGNPAPTIAVQDASESSDQGPIKPNMAHKAWYMHWFHTQNKSVLILDLNLNFQRS